MYDAFFVGGSHCVGYGGSERDDLLDGKPALGEKVVERLSFDQFHREEVGAVSFLDRVERDDVRMIEGGDGARFALEAGEALGIAGDVGRQHLEGHVAAELGIGGAKDLAHSTCANGGSDAVMG